MTGTFTLTGRILDKSTEPVARAKLVLSSNVKVLADPAADEVYAPTPRITTDDDGYLCVADANGVPDETPGVPLVVGVQYRLRSVNRALIDTLVFTAPDAGTELDIADIVPEPPDTPPGFADVILELLASIDSSIEQYGRAPGLDLDLFYAALAKRSARRCNIVVAGASLVEGFPVTGYDLTITQRLVSRLRDRYDVTGGGRGYVGIPTAGVVLATPVTVSGGARDPAAVGAAEAFNFGANRTCWYTNGSGYVEYACGPDATHVDIWHMKSSVGGATAGAWSIDGGAETTFSTLNGTDILYATRVEVNPGDVLRVTRSGAGYVILTGFTEYGGDETSGIQVHNAGHCGYTLARWSAAPTQAGGWREHLATLNPDLLVLGGDIVINSASSGRTPVQAQTDLTALLTALRAGPAPLPTVPILFVGPYDPSGGVSLPAAWSEYVAAMETAAAADVNAGVLDLSTVMPPTDGDPWGIYDADETHGDADGSAYDLIADHLFRAITP